MNYDKNRLLALGFSEETIALLDFACWDSHKQVGMKKKGDRMVPNCVPKSEHKEGDIATAEMTPNFLPKKDIPGGGDPKNPQMNEGVPIRMPRMEAIKKAMNKNGTLAMRAASNFSELGPEETNGAMVVNQLRVIREKTDILLGMLDGTENLPPWCFVKITNAGTGMASVADYLRYGVEV